MIPFNKFFLTGKEFDYIQEAVCRSHISGNGIFTKKCELLLEKYTHCKKAMLVHSCTAALEMAAMLIDIQPGDEIIMPSFTFVSTANAFLIRGAVPVFVDICPDTLNINTQKIRQAITSKTKAIVPVHYAGVACEMDEIMQIANEHNLFVIEDAAQAIMSSYKNKPLGSFGHIATLSFHETKNITSGEGGALLINDEKLIERAEIIREKGTNRTNFLLGNVDKYTWVDMGSSYLPSEIISAFLLAQLEQADVLIENRLKVWNLYNDALNPLEVSGLIKRPHIPEYCTNNAHMYYILLRNRETRDKLIKSLNQDQINAIFHYIPLHSSPMGKKHCIVGEDLEITDNVSQVILRLPMWIGLSEKDIEKICNSIKRYMEECK